MNVGESSFNVNAQVTSHHVISQNSPLFRLPRELRDEIYEIHFAHVATEDNRKLHIRESGVPNPLPALMRTCSQIYTEVRPVFIRASRILIASEPSLTLTQLWLEPVVKDVRTITFLSWEMFRTNSATSRCLKWDRNIDMPWLPCQPTGPTMYITGSSSPTPTPSSIPSPIHFLFTLPNLQHIELGIPLKLIVDPPNCKAQHYYDLDSFTSITSLRSVTLYLDIAGAQGGRLYKFIMKKRNEEWLSRTQNARTKAAFEGAWGLKNWLEEGFREKRLVNVDVRIVIENIESVLGLKRLGLAAMPT